MYPAGFLLMMRIVKSGPSRGVEKADRVESGRPRGPVDALPLAGGEQKEVRR